MDIDFPLHHQPEIQYDLASKIATGALLLLTLYLCYDNSQAIEAFFLPIRDFFSSIATLFAKTYAYISNIQDNTLVIMAIVLLLALTQVICITPIRRGYGERGFGRLVCPGRADPAVLDILRGLHWLGSWGGIVTGRQESVKPNRSAEQVRLLCDGTSTLFEHIDIKK